MKGVPLTIHLETVQALGQGNGVGMQGVTGRQMHSSQLNHRRHHHAAGIVDVLQGLFRERDGFLDHLDEFLLAVRNAL